MAGAWHGGPNRGGGPTTGVGKRPAPPLAAAPIMLRPRRGGGGTLGPSPGTAGRAGTPGAGAGWPSSAGGPAAAGAATVPAGRGAATLWVLASGCKMGGRANLAWCNMKPAGVGRSADELPVAAACSPAAALAPEAIAWVVVPPCCAAPEGPAAAWGCPFRPGESPPGSCSIEGRRMVGLPPGSGRPRSDAATEAARAAGRAGPGEWPPAPPGSNAPPAPTPAARGGSVRGLVRGAGGLAPAIEPSFARCGNGSGGGCAAPPAYVAASAIVTAPLRPRSPSLPAEGGSEGGDIESGSDGRRASGWRGGAGGGGGGGGACRSLPPGGSGVGVVLVGEGGGQGGGASPSAEGGDGLKIKGRRGSRALGRTSGGMGGAPPLFPASGAGAVGAVPAAAESTDVDTEKTSEEVWTWADVVCGSEASLGMGPEMDDRGESDGGLCDKKEF